MSVEIEFNYFTGKESEMLTFYRIPKLLVTDSYFRNLSSDAKILYGLMLDRRSLSAKNGWIDKENHVYIYFSIEDVMEMLACGKNKAVKTMGELDDKEGIGLIERVKQGQGKPTIIYVKNFVYHDAESSSEVYISNFKNPQNQTSRSRECKLLEVYKEDPNKNIYNNTEFNNKSYQIEPDRTPEVLPSDLCRNEQLIKKNIEYQLLLDRYPYEQTVIDEICDLILEMVSTQSKTICIAKVCYPAELVKSRFLKLNSDHIEYVIDCMKKNTSKVRDIKKYMLTSLFNAPATIGNYYMAEVSHDMSCKAEIV